MTITALSRLPTPSQIKGYDRELQMRAHLRDIYVSLPGMYNGPGQPIPNAIFMKVAEKTKGTNNVTITMKLPLIGAPVTGTTRLEGTEEQPRTISSTIYRNNYSKAVSEESYGVRALDQIDYGIYEANKKELATYAQQYKGLKIRQALIERYASNLWAGDTAAVCVPTWNPHFYVQGASDADQPVYDVDNTVYTNNIVNAIMAAGGFAPTNNNIMTYRLMNKLAMRALDQKIWTLDIGGNPSYIFCVSELQASIFSDPTFSTSTGGAVWKDITRLSEKVQNWYNLLGCFKTAIGVDIYVVVDHKCPTLTGSGTGAPFSMQANYVWMGDVDRRQRDLPWTRDACILLGKSPLVDFEPEPLHYVKQDDNYWKQMGYGIAGVDGVQLVCFDQENPASTSLEHYGSMVVVLGRITY